MVVEQALDDANWSARCVARMIELDPLLQPELVRPIADDMCSRARWRSMVPEAAAQTIFDFGKGPVTGPL